MRVLVTASRDHPDSFIEVIHLDLFRLWNECRQRGEKLTVIHGKARGGDKLAGMVADELGANHYAFPAEWDYYRSQGKLKQAGNDRNVEMLDEIKPDLVLGYPLPQSVGTWRCINEAHARGIPVTVR